jgi:hypothetical protein
MDKMEQIRATIIETLKQNPMGLSPKEIYEKLNKNYDKKDLQEVLSFLCKEDLFVVNKENRKLTFK